MGKNFPSDIVVDPTPFLLLHKVNFIYFFPYFLKYVHPTFPFSSSSKLSSLMSFCPVYVALLLEEEPLKVEEGF